MLDNAPIRAKSLISPVFGCLMAIAIGIVLLISSEDTTSAIQQSSRSRELSSMMTSAEIALSTTHTELYKALNWKQTSVEEPLISESLKSAMSSLGTAKMLIERIGSDFKEADKTALGEIDANLKAYEESVVQVADLINVDISMATLLSGN